MATKEQIKQYEKDYARYLNKQRSFKGLNITTAILSPLWTCAGAAILMYWAITKFMPASNMNEIATILCVLAMGVGAAIACAMGVYTIYLAYWDIDDSGDTLAFGVYSIFLQGVLPGIFLLVTSKLYSVADEAEMPDHPKAVEAKKKAEQEEAERERKRIEREKRDIRRYFTEDDDDVGEIPDINKLDFKDLKKAWDEEEKAEQEK